MGKGGQAIVSKGQTLDDGVWVSKYKPLEPNAPKIPTKKEAKNAIPDRCFVRNGFKGMMYVFRDLMLAAGCVYITNSTLSTDLPSSVLGALGWIFGWSMYAFWMGTILTGPWVLAHECGHGSFSPSQTFNDIIGFVLHQALLVPYFAWQYSHAKHHRRTNHLTDGESHVPSTRKENGLGEHNERESFYAVMHEAMGDGAFAAFEVFSHCFIGYPLYLMGVASTGRMAADGTPLADGEIIDHFRPTSKMFPRKIRGKILMSTLTCAATLILLFKLSLDYGFLPVALYYWGPYTWTNFWLVTYTWLQHTDPSVPQYGADEWTFMRGALTTIDRDYGIFCWFHHKIGSTHVAHHLFHEIPFYNADEATLALKGLLDPLGLYNFDPTPWYKALWRVAKTCHYVEDVKGIQYYKSLEDIPLTKDLKKVA